MGEGAKEKKDVHKANIVLLSLKRGEGRASLLSMCSHGVLAEWEIESDGDQEVVGG